MNRRTERIANLIRNTIGQMLLSKLSDPRIDPARTSITRVEVPEDLLTAKVYVSVLGTEGQQRRTIQALQHAAGHIQELMARQVQIRNTPVLNFVPDLKFKKTQETYLAIEKAMEEIRKKDEARAETEAEGSDSGTGGEPSAGEDGEQ